ncbi:MAG: recombinase family protein [Chloroflexi bacterium]|nr:recombinase family protein [Chloroflexota bacterium]
MNRELHSKVTTNHLRRLAYLYVRQSTLRQVFENSESTKRQYALRERAVALGWPLDRVVVVDSDLGQSGADSDRQGFQKLVAAVGMGEVGIVLGLEVSRLARSSADWHRLLEICALTETLILDEDGLYDPGHFNDRLLLGLKGTMSEAELHVLRARLIGGQRAKASRGELELRLPVGLVYGPDGKVGLDPDQQVQGTVRSFFETFRRAGSATATVRSFREQGLLFPRRLRTGPRMGELIWSPLLHWRALRILSNPRYAGAFAYGRTATRRLVGGKTTARRLPREEWHTLILDAHPGYISWADYEENLRRLQENAQANGSERRKSPPREGPALLQGLVICGRCGERMTVRYYQHRGGPIPEYVCQRDGIANARPICQRVRGSDLDRAVGDLLVETVSPLALEVALAVQDELQTRAEEADRLRRQQVERARYEAELAQRRYLRVDPDNRLVADSLEADWNAKLRALAAAQEEYERRREAEGLFVDGRQRTQIMALAVDFPRLWRDPSTPQRERKRMLRLLVEDVTLVKGEAITCYLRFKGGASRTLSVPAPLSLAEQRKTDAAVIRAIDVLLDDHTDEEVAAILNERGLRTSQGIPFTRLRVGALRHAHGLADRFSRLRVEGKLTLAEMAARLDVCTATVKQWRDYGLLVAYVYNDKGECLFDPPQDDLPVKGKWKRPHRQTLRAAHG